MTTIATAPGKLIITGEYAVLDGASALVLAVNRRVSARAGAPLDHSDFLAALADEFAARDLPDAAAHARAVVVDSSAFYADPTTKLGLGSSAAVTVAATAYALAATTHASRTSAHRTSAHGTSGTSMPDGTSTHRTSAHGTSGTSMPDRTSTDRTSAHGTSGTSIPDDSGIDRDLVFAIAAAAHANAQRARGAAGSGADVASATYGGAIRFGMAQHPRALAWPGDALVLVPFFTGRSADTAAFVARIAAATGDDVALALRAISDASEAACTALAEARTADARVAAFLDALRADAEAFDALARAAALPALVPACVRAVRAALPDAVVKTTGAGGGDVAIVVAPIAADRARLAAAIRAAHGAPLDLAVDPRGVDITSASE